MPNKFQIQISDFGYMSLRNILVLSTYRKATFSPKKLCLQDKNGVLQTLVQFLMINVNYKGENPPFTCRLTNGDSNILAA